MKRDLTEISKPLETLKNDFQFFVSITSYKSKGNRYYNLCISRVIKGSPKNVGLGREDKIKEQLLEHFKGNRKKVSEIKKDWKTFLKNECGVYDTYDKIMKLIHKNKGSWKI